jgi:hypothetical protein
MSIDMTSNGGLLRLKEASAEFKISYWAMRDWCLSGKLSYHRPGKFFLVSRNEISRLLQESLVQRQ